MEPKHLRVLYVFKNLTDPELQEILPLCKPKKLIEGAFLLREGEEYNGQCYGVLKGRLSALKSVEGQPDKEVGEMKPGDVIGEMSVVMSQSAKRTASVRVEEDAIIAEVDAQKLQKLMDQNIAIGYKIQKSIMAVLGERLIKTTETISELMYMGVLSGSIRFN